jgi:hypothetical protein
MAGTAEKFEAIADRCSNFVGSVTVALRHAGEEANGKYQGM